MLHYQLLKNVEIGHPITKNQEEYRRSQLEKDIREVKESLLEKKGVSGNIRKPMYAEAGV